LSGALPHTEKNGKSIFCGIPQNVVAKVVGNGDTKNPAKYGAKIQKFAFSKAKTLA
jgi:hypothetical protein